MRLIALFFVLMLALVPVLGHAQTSGQVATPEEGAVVVVDAQFASVARILTSAFEERTGQALNLHVLDTAPADGAGVPELADILLAPNAELPARLVAEGLALPESVVTYAMGPTGTEAAVNPRDAVLLASAGGNVVAREFMDFLVTSEAWDLVVTHGFGAY